LNDVFDELGYIAILPFGEIAKLPFNNAGKVYQAQAWVGPAQVFT
jgi:hypothetical protein